MTSNILSTNHKKLALNQAKSYWWLFLICNIIYFFVGPVPLMLSYQNQARYGMTTESQQVYVDEFFMSWFNGGTGYYAFYIVSIILSALMAIVMFSYLHSKRQVNFYHSLPVTRKQLFWHNYFLGIVVSYIPLVLMMIVMMMVAAFNGGAAYISISDMLMHLWQILLFSLLSYSLGVLAGHLTGTILTQIAMTGVLHFGLLAVAGCTVSNFVTFYNTFDTRTIDEYLLSLSPFTYLMLYLDRAGSGQLGLDGFQWLGVMEMVMIIVIALIISGLAWVCYQKRPSEAASSPLVFQRSKPVMKWILMYIAASLGGMLFLEIGGKLSFVFGILVFALLTHMFSEVILNKDFKALLKNMKGFALFAVVLCGFYGSLYLGVWGYDDYVPKNIDKVEAINFNINGTSMNMQEERYTQREHIAAIVTIMEQIVSQEAYHHNSTIYDISEREDAFNRCWIEVQYQMSNGREINRRYDSVPFELIRENVAMLYDTQGFKEVNYYTLLNLTKKQVVAYSIDPLLGGYYTANLQENEGYRTDGLKNDPYFEPLMQALTHDVLNRTAEDVEKGAVYHISMELAGMLDQDRYGYGYRILEVPVYATDTETMAVLTQIASEQRFSLMSMTDIADNVQQMDIYAIKSEKVSYKYQHMQYRDMMVLQHQGELEKVRQITDPLQIAQLMQDAVVAGSQVSTSSPLLNLNYSYMAVCYNKGADMTKILAEQQAINDETMDDEISATYTKEADRVIEDDIFVIYFLQGSLPLE